MHIKFLITETELKQLVVAHLGEKLGNITFAPENLKIEVKSKQNYKSEWEVAEFRATYEAFGQ